MGTEIDEGLSFFDIAKRIQLIRKNSKGIYENFITELNENINSKSKDLHKYLYGLGVTVSALALLNRKSDSFFLLQNRELQFKGENKFPSYPRIPFNCSDPIKDKIIELLYIGNRDQQKIIETNEYGGIKSPEFIEKLLRNIEDQDELFLIIDIGQIIFYIYAWLYGIRLLQQSQTENSFWEILSIETKNGVNIKDIDSHFWTNTIISEQYDQFEIEHSLFKLIYPYKDEFLNSLVVKKQYFSFKDDWRFLNLIDDEDKVTDNLIILFKYLKINNYPFDFTEKKDFIYYHKLILENIEQKFGYKNKTNTISLNKYFNDIHKNAPFPVIPYFFEFIFSGKYFHHIVMPIWFSHKNNYRILKEERYNSSSHEIEKIWITTDISAIVVFSYNSKDLTDSKLFEIQALFRQLYSETIDEIFYGRIIEANIQSEHSISLFDTISHETVDVIQSIERYPKEINKLIDVRVASIDIDRPEILVPPRLFDIISNSSIVPNINVFKSYVNYLYLWYHKKNLLKVIFPMGDIKNSIAIYDIINAIYEKVYSIECFKRYIGNWNTLEDISEFQDTISQLTKPSLIINCSDYLAVTKSTDSYIQVLIAAISNTIKHALNKKCRISINVTNKKDILIHELTTTYEETLDRSTIEKINDKKNGTRDHLDLLLMQFRSGRLIDFKPNIGYHEFSILFSINIKEIQNEKDMANN